MNAAAKLLTAEDLKERWQLEPNSGIVNDLVNAGKLVPVNLSAKEPKRGKSGPKFFRFRLADVEAFEEANRVRFIAPETDKTAASLPPLPSVGKVPGWDGKARGRPFNPSKSGR